MTSARGRDHAILTSGTVSTNVSKGVTKVIIQVVNFQLNGLGDADYRALCDGLAPELARVPGLVSKVWLADEATNTYGGVYTWADRGSMEAFARSDIFQAFAANPRFVNITATAFGVLEGPSQVTRTPIAIAA